MTTPVSLFDVRSVVPPIVLLLVVGLGLACGPDGGLDVKAASGASRSSADVRLLAEEYLYKQVGPEESQAIRDQIRALSHEEDRAFGEELRSLQLGETVPDPTSETALLLALDLALEQRAQELGVSFLDLAPADVDEVLAATVGTLNVRAQSEASTNEDSEFGTAIQPLSICLLPAPWASCSRVSFTSQATGASCARGCTRGSGNDRTSNETCELGACDHRIWFPTASLRPNIDGTTSAADCVILHWPAIISRYDGRMEVGIGIGGPAACRILLNVGTTLRNNLQVF